MSKNQPKKNTSFRASAVISEALERRVNESGKSQTEIIEAALACFLGITTHPTCDVMTRELKTLHQRIDELISQNNLVA